MGIAVLLEVAIFLLGAAAGALLTRVQWRAFKQKVSQEMMEEFGAGRLGEDGATRFHHPGAANFVSPYVSESRHSC